ncbi:MAG: tetratricopeptide repeat protein, partial [Anaerolineales bacterium]|nr:tetratricopeptide repeat protein [Anaerolineales bacterium]
LHKLAQICCGFGDYLEGKQLAEECLVISRELGRHDLSAQALDVLGWATVCLGEYDAAEAYYQASLAASAEIEDRFGMAMALGGIGSVAWARGPATMAQGHELFVQSLALCRAIGHRQQVSSRLWYLAQMDYDRGDYEAAQP